MIELGKSSVVAVNMANLLILGGTQEALQLAQQTVNDNRLRIVTSLAGRTARPARIPGEIRSGGFGGSQGLIDYLRAHAIDGVVNATHPFASGISEYALSACRQTNLPYLRFLRAAWSAQIGDNWYCVDDTAAAAKRLAVLGKKRVFLACGRKDIDQFAHNFANNNDCYFLVRLIEPVEQELPLNDYELILARGPFAEAQEIELLKHYRIDVIVSKNSGGSGAYAKLSGARKLSIAVVMIKRPAQPASEMATELPQVLTWIDDKLCQ